MRPSHRPSGFDSLSLFFILSLALIGLFMIYAVEYPDAGTLFRLPITTNFQKQSLFVIVGGFLFLFVYLIETRIWRSFAYPLYFFSLILLLAVALLGSTVKGSTSWFIIAGFSFQPSEFAKFTTTLALATYLSHYTTQLKQASDRWISIAVIFSPVLLILIQPDAGSALVFMMLFLVLLRADLNPFYYLFALLVLLTAIFSLQYEGAWVISFVLFLAIFFLAYKQLQKTSWILASIGTAALCGVILYQTTSYWSLFPAVLLLLALSVTLGRQKQWATLIILMLAVAFLISISTGTQYAFDQWLKPHQKERINAWLNPEACDPQGSLYNLLQSQMAIGSGGFQGKGYLKGTMTQFDYVPEQSTDFIFSTVGEEFGFIGSFIVIVLCFGLIFRTLHMAEHMRTPFGTYYAYGLASVFFFHVLINIGMTMGLMPVIGIPLPFVSYGGSSILAFSLMFAFLLKLYSERRRT